MPHHRRRKGEPQEVFLIQTTASSLRLPFLVYRACRTLGPRAKLDIGGAGAGSGGGATFLGRASRRVRIICSLVLWNLGVPGATPVATTISSGTSSYAGRCF